MSNLRLTALAQKYFSEHQVNSLFINYRSAERYLSKRVISPDTKMVNIFLETVQCINSLKFEKALERIKELEVTVNLVEELKGASYAELLRKYALAQKRIKELENS